MEKITGHLFIREENETKYRPWKELTEEEVKTISDCLNRQAAHAANFKEIAQAADKCGHEGQAIE